MKHDIRISPREVWILSLFPRTPPELLNSNSIGLLQYIDELSHPTLKDVGYIFLKVKNATEVNQDTLDIVKILQNWADRNKV